MFMTALIGLSARLWPDYGKKGIPIHEQTKALIPPYVMLCRKTLTTKRQSESGTRIQVVNADVQQHIMYFQAMSLRSLGLRHQALVLSSWRALWRCQNQYLLPVFRLAYD